MSHPIGLAISTATVAAVSAYVCFHAAEVVALVWRTRSGGTPDVDMLRVLRGFFIARLVAMLGIAWASPDPSIGLVAAALLTLHAAFSEFAWRKNGSPLAFTRWVGGALLFEAIIWPLTTDSTGRVARAVVGLMLMCRPHQGRAEPMPMASWRELFGMRLVGCIGALLFGALTIQLLIEPTLLPAIALSDVLHGGFL